MQSKLQESPHETLRQDEEIKQQLAVTLKRKSAPTSPLGFNFEPIMFKLGMVTAPERRKTSETSSSALACHKTQQSSANVAGTSTQDSQGDVSAQMTLKLSSKQSSERSVEVCALKHQMSPKTSLKPTEVELNTTTAKRKRRPLKKLSVIEMEDITKEDEL